MPYPEGDADFRTLVRAMRELGVVQAFGVVLGPEPTKLATLTAQEKPDPAEVARARRDERIEAARQVVRDKVGRDLTDAQADQYIDPAVFE